MSLTLETLYLELSLLRTSPSLNNATVGAGLPLNTHVRTASEPKVAMRLGVTDVLHGIAGERKHPLTSHKDAVFKAVRLVGPLW